MEEEVGEGEVRLDGWQVDVESTWFIALNYVPKPNFFTLCFLCRHSAECSSSTF